MISKRIKRSLMLFSAITVTGVSVTPILFGKYGRDSLDDVKSKLVYLENKKSIGYPNVVFDIFKYQNPVTEEYEYFLNDYGKKFLIKRLIDTGIIGPEISSLKEIVLSSPNVGSHEHETLGRYIPLSRSIFINTNPFLDKPTNDEFALNEDISSNETQEKRVEAILQTLVHEYGHHLMNSYANTVIDKEEQIKLINPTDKTYETWNKSFVDGFRKIFFDQKNPINESLYNTDANARLVVNGLIRLLSKTSKNTSPKLIYKKNGGTSISAKDIFEFSNTLVPNSKKSVLNKNTNWIFGNYIIEGFIDKINAELVHSIPSKRYLTYLYGLSEQTTRKLLLATFKPYTNDQDKFIQDEPSSQSGLSDILYSADVKTNQIFPNKYKFYPFFHDYIFRNNLSKSFIELIKTSMGFKEKSEISYMSSKSPWDVISADQAKTNIRLSEGNNAKNILRTVDAGGFLNKEEINKWTKIGYIGEDGFKPLADIIIRKFNMGSKQKLLSTDWENKVSTDDDYFWFTDKEIDLTSSDAINKPLAFGSTDGKSFRKLTSVRDSDETGHTTNYQNGMEQTINKMTDHNNSTKRWGIYATKNDKGDIVFKDDILLKRID